MGALAPSLPRARTAAGELTLDIGCGEGRMARALAAAGHRVIGVDVTELLARAASHHDDPVPAVVADAAAPPFRDGVADLAASFMTLMDTDDFSAAVSEAGRLLRPGGRYCLAIVHPLAESGRFLEDGSFLVDRSYLQVAVSGRAASPGHRDDVPHRAPPDRVSFNDPQLAVRTPLPRTFTSPPTL
jgi:SAM-dependent methyltransferase